MTSHSTMREQPQLETEAAAQLFDNWFDPIEAGLRDRAREFLQAMLEGELDEVLDRSRYARRAKRSADASERMVGVAGHRHGHRPRTLLGTFGQLKIEVPRARLDTPDGKTTEWKSQALRSYQRRQGRKSSISAAPHGDRAASSGNRSWRSAAQRYSIVTLRPCPLLCVNQA